MATIDRTTTPSADAATATTGPPVQSVDRSQVMRLFMGMQKRDQLQALDDLPGTSGMVRIAAPGTPVFIIRDPQHARHVLVTNQDNYVKGMDYKILAVLLGDGLLTNLNQEQWQSQRRLVQPLFAKRHLAPMGTHMTDATADWLDALERAQQTGEELELGSAMMELTLDVVVRALFGASIDRRAVETVGDAMTDVLRAAQANFRVIGLFRGLSKLPRVNFEDLLHLRWRHRARADAATIKLDGVVDQLIDGAQAKGADGDDLLSLLLSARDESGEAMSRTQVRDEVMTFLGAGHETTANAMTWMWLALSRNPEARRRMVAEVDEVLQGRVPTFDDLDKLPWTQACLEEAMRLHPPVPGVSRMALADDEIDGVKIPKGSVTLVLPYLIHRNPDLWPNPEGYDPARFMPGPDGRPPARHKQAFMPFGAGRRICVGNGFALMEGVLLAAMTVQRFEFDLQPGTVVRREFAITLRPRDGVPVKVRPRTDGPLVQKASPSPDAIAAKVAAAGLPADADEATVAQAAAAAGCPFHADDAPKASGADAPAAS
ncbi:MAG: cytochrome P450 [Solirubrobacteraceae bacterium]|nr:cytochrome P450 [Solirubrobacteraceae bacterium]